MGQNNNNFTSLSFVSNSLFYDHRASGINKNDIYVTTNKFHQSKSLERIQDKKKSNICKDKSVPRKFDDFQPMTRVGTNMTTLQNDLGKNINKIYNEKLGMNKQLKNSDIECKTGSRKRKGLKNEKFKNFLAQDSSRTPQKSDYKYKSRNKELERWVTAPTLQIEGTEELGMEDKEAIEIKNIQKPPKIPCRQGSNWCELLKEELRNRNKTSRKTSQTNLRTADKNYEVRK